MATSLEFNKCTPMFIDSDLGDGEKGEVEGERIFHDGFSNLNLSTNFPSSGIHQPAWIKKIITKDPCEALGLTKLI